ncbi:MAG: HD domain-containing protein [bacterium]|nr:HD domain-containing protein [bacterium]
MESEKIKKIVNFVFELGHLKKEGRSGFKYVGVKNPDTLAEHSLRAAQIGYILAEMEKELNPKETINPERVATMLVVHDNGEIRIGDFNKLTGSYLKNHKEAEQKSFSDQIENLGGKIKEKWAKYFEEIEGRKTKEGIIAKDADLLEVAFQAKEYFDLGYKDTELWFINVGNEVQTESAKKLFETMKETKFSEWWQEFDFYKKYLDKIK